MVLNDIHLMENKIMNTYLYVQENGADNAKAIVSGAPTWAAEYCLLDNEYLNYEDIDPSAAHCASCLHLPALEKALSDFELVAKLGGLEEANDQIVHAHKNNYQTISISVVVSGQSGFGCMYIDTLEKTVTRIKQGLVQN